MLQDTALEYQVYFFILQLSYLVYILISLPYLPQKSHEIGGLPYKNIFGRPLQTPLLNVGSATNSQGV